MEAQLFNLYVMNLGMEEELRQAKAAQERARR